MIIREPVCAVDMRVTMKEDFWKAFIHWEAFTLFGSSICKIARSNDNPFC